MRSNEGVDHTYALGDCKACYEEQSSRFEHFVVCRVNRREYPSVKRWKM